MLKICVTKPVAYVDGCLHLLPPRKFWTCPFGNKTAQDVQNRPARTLARYDLLMGVWRGKIQLDADVLTVLTELRARESRAAVLADGVHALADKNPGLLDEYRKGVNRAGRVVHEHHVFLLDMLVNEIDGVSEPAQSRIRREGAQGVDGYELKRT